MRWILLLALCWTIVLNGLSQQNARKEHHTLTVKITGIENQRGVIEIALYKDPNKFAKVGQTYRIVRIKPEGNELIHEFKYLEEGEYAVCLFHDENNNKVCDKNFLGIPTEAYAFSNNIRPKLSIPSFYDCSTNLNKDKSFTIKMYY
jgi:uncharacterized protein (DUF2141 family)